ncbi:hypothetical protein Emtol_1556 [Emticicia oligotrophica DSM 17448]|uniref:DUF983 domain-containing protein n=1 Tax=Emticicia oligotrophica (strain DSM 17448 / CIP 109782 / MTCC 6937 / GPTSA100-15) TaxID=929562 RepID=A0ABM5N060_EMTOG|nr:DUF983 domain-containing protein [Emticicia oligotrophica]AFK02702.1 hypothetical protein Emtol_1556 [Emticicia oligotrophica DSM 17448]
MNKLEATVKMKCPKCHKGDLFENNNNPYAFGKITAMHENCPNCGLRYEKETGFFYGAMYVSYMFNIAFFVIALVSYYMFFEESIDWKLYIGGYLLFTVLIAPVMFRMSRSIWLQIFYK